MLHGHGGDSDMKCRITYARTVAMVGRGGRAAHGRAVGEMDWVVVVRGRRALPAKVSNGDGSARLCCCGRES